ncbi:MAG: hypothetical protein HDT39_05345 [Lachnospiraceae bacterium]|nr:hypothetical protein [Lachnospiraceae bacterium]
MKFILECDEMDGLIFIDKSYLAELNSDMLYAMDILLDPFGKSELVFDFPNETWETVRPRETKRIREFCGQGKMIIWLFDGTEKECKIEKSNEITDSPKWLHIPTGKLLAVTASELIQCLSYPELEMEKIFELEVEDGWYAIWNKGIDKIMYCKKEPPNSIPSNIQEMYGR